MFDGLPADLGSPELALIDIWQVANDGRPVVTGPEARAAMAASSAYLSRLVDERRRIYGVTTGYGPLASHYVLPEHAGELQRNLVYHLATGVGRPFSVPQTRAIMAARVSSLARGYSAVGREVFDLLLACLDRGVVPVVPEMGTVGASGDLTPLAHIALVLIGEGEASLRGRSMPGALALAAAGLAPVSLGQKDGLALVNGTAAMTGISCLNGVGGRRAAGCALRLGLLYAELLEAPVDAYDARLGSVKPHPGQQRVHEVLLSLVKGGSRLTPGQQPPPALEAEVPAVEGVVLDQKLLQSPYTARCLPQIFGAVFDLLKFHDEVVTAELRSVTDNPLVFAEDEAIIHGGNFYGQHVSFAADIFQLAIGKIALHAERCVARICDPLTNGGLPAFLASGPVGRNSGFMGAQVTASALVGELRTRSGAASIQSIPTNNNNQDVVTMGTIGARKAAELLDLTWNLLAIEAIVLTQAAELLGAFRSSHNGFAESSRLLCSFVRERVSFLDRDRPLASDITMLSGSLRETAWPL
jgi:tyrosine ammonia-lyase